MSDLRCALYLRVSTKDGGQDTDNQRLQMQQFCLAQGWTIVSEYEDHESGAHPDRPGFKAMMRDVALRRFDVLLFWSLDRLTREGSLPTLQYLNALSEFGIGYRSFTEPYLDSCGVFKDAVIAILGAIARQERLRISQRVKAGLERARLKGTRTGRPIGRPKVIIDRRRVLELRNARWSWRRIARDQGISIATARRVCASQRNFEAEHPCPTLAMI